MELVRGLRNYRPDGRGSAVVIGNVDGVHIGHRALVEVARQCARESGARLTVLTFEPHPREFIAPAEAPARLMRVGEKYAALRALGVDRLVVIRFDARLKGQSPEAFAKTVLAEGLEARHVIVGEGFRFGAGQAGTVASLEAAGRRVGFEVRALPSVILDEDRVSSTRIRAALEVGDLPQATRLLGRPYGLAGRVVEGQKLGRTLGFPTANFRLHRDKVPLSGIFAVRVLGIPGQPSASGVASLGTRPTVGGIEPLLEVHVFDFNGDLYGLRLHVEFIAKLRDEAKFASLDAMMVQMHKDAARAREILAEP